MTIAKLITRTKQTHRSTPQLASRSDGLPQDKKWLPQLQATNLTDLDQTTYDLLCSQGSNSDKWLIAVRNSIPDTVPAGVIFTIASVLWESNLPLPSGLVMTGWLSMRANPHFSAFYVIGGKLRPRRTCDSRESSHFYCCFFRHCQYCPRRRRFLCHHHGGAGFKKHRRTITEMARRCKHSWDRAERALSLSVVQFPVREDLGEDGIFVFFILPRSLGKDVFLAVWKITYKYGGVEWRCFASTLKQNVLKLGLGWYAVSSINSTILLKEKVFYSNFKSQLHIFHGIW